MAINIYKHNSRSFFDVYNALVQAYPRKPTWLFQEMAGLFDFQSELMNRIATDILYPQTRESAYAFAASCDYYPSEAEGAAITVTFTLNSAMSKLLLKGYQISGISPSTGKMVYYEIEEDAGSGGTDTIIVDARQQRTSTDIPLFSIKDSQDFKDYPVDGYTNIVRNSFSLKIEDQIWTRVDNFDTSLPTSRHFMLIYQSSGKVRVRFGDNKTGLKPTVNSTVFGTFAVTQGAAGKMDANTVTINAGNDGSIKSITHPGSEGGMDPEPVSSIIKSARDNVRLREIVWSKEDLEIAAKASDPRVLKALGFPGEGTAAIHIVPAGGGVPSAGLLSIMENYVEARTQFGSLPIVGVVPAYVPINVTATTTVRSGFDPVTVQNLVNFALIMTVAANDNEMIEYYEGFGIDLCRTNIINPLFGLGFVEADNPALEYIIQKWISVLGEREYREWGQALEIGELWVMGDSLYVYGSDIFSLVSPTSNVPVTNSEIIAKGTIVVT
jgi:hypothetical protein